MWQARGGASGRASNLCQGSTAGAGCFLLGLAVVGLHVGPAGLLRHTEDTSAADQASPDMVDYEENGRRLDDGCRPMCGSNTHEWSLKCGWVNCGLCAECGQEALECKNMCNSNTNSWLTKCSWPGCSPCSMCGSITSPPTATVTTTTETSTSPSPCKSMCATNDKPWSRKCTWMNCLGCGQCSPSTTGAFSITATVSTMSRSITSSSGSSTRSSTLLSSTTSSTQTSSSFTTTASVSTTSDTSTATRTITVASSTTASTTSLTFTATRTTTTDSTTTTASSTTKTPSTTATSSSDTTTSHSSSTTDSNTRISSSSTHTSISTRTQTSISTNTGTSATATLTSITRTFSTETMSSTRTASSTATTRTTHTSLTSSMTETSRSSISTRTLSSQTTSSTLPTSTRTTTLSKSSTTTLTRSSVSLSSRTKTSATTLTFSTSSTSASSGTTLSRSTATSTETTTTETRTSATETSTLTLTNSRTTTSTTSISTCETSLSMTSMSALSGSGKIHTTSTRTGITSQDIQAHHLLDTIESQPLEGDPVALLDALDEFLLALPEADGAWSPSYQAAIKNATIRALQFAAWGANGTGAGVQRIGESVESLLTQLGLAANMSNSELVQLAEVMAESLDDGSTEGVEEAAAQAAIGGLAAIIAASLSITGSAGSSLLAIRLEALAKTLGRALLARTPDGQVAELRVVNSAGAGMALSISKFAITDVEESGLLLGSDVLVPFGAFASGTRRLTSSCTDIILQKTEYTMSNIYYWAVSQWNVPNSATLTRVEIQNCGQAGDSTSLARLAHAIHITLATPWPWPSAQNVRPVCLRFNATAQSWSGANLRVHGSPAHGSLLVTCLSAFSDGTYALAFEFAAGVSTTMQSSEDNALSASVPQEVSTTPNSPPPTTPMLVPSETQHLWISPRNGSAGISRARDAHMLVLVILCPLPLVAGGLYLCLLCRRRWERRSSTTGKLKHIQFPGLHQALEQDRDGGDADIERDEDSVPDEEVNVNCPPGSSYTEVELFNDVVAHCPPEAFHTNVEDEYSVTASPKEFFSGLAMQLEGETHSRTWFSVFSALVGWRDDADCSSSRIAERTDVVPAPSGFEQTEHEDINEDEREEEEDVLDEQEDVDEAVERATKNKTIPKESASGYQCVQTAEQDGVRENPAGQARASPPEHQTRPRPVASEGVLGLLPNWAEPADPGGSFPAWFTADAHVPSPISRATGEAQASKEIMAGPAEQLQDRGCQDNAVSSCHLANSTEESDSNFDSNLSKCALAKPIDGQDTAVSSCHLATSTEESDSNLSNCPLADPIDGQEGMDGRYADRMLSKFTRELSGLSLPPGEDIESDEDGNSAVGFEEMGGGPWRDHATVAPLVSVPTPTVIMTPRVHSRATPEATVGSTVHSTGKANKMPRNRDKA